MRFPRWYSAPPEDPELAYLIADAERHPFRPLVFNLVVASTMTNKGPVIYREERRLGF